MDGYALCEGWKWTSVDQYTPTGTIESNKELDRKSGLRGGRVTALETSTMVVQAGPI